MSIDTRRAIVRAEALLAAAVLDKPSDPRGALHGVQIQPAEGGGALLLATDGLILAALHDSSGYADGLPTLWRHLPLKRTTLADWQKTAAGRLVFIEMTADAVLPKQARWRAITAVGLQGALADQGDVLSPWCADAGLMVNEQFPAIVPLLRDVPGDDATLLPPYWLMPETMNRLVDLAQLVDPVEHGDWRRIRTRPQGTDFALWPLARGRCRVVFRNCDSVVAIVATRTQEAVDLPYNPSWLDGLVPPATAASAA